MTKPPFYNPKEFICVRDAYEIVKSKLQYEFWAERALNMMEHVADRGHGKMDYVRVVRVDKDWPREGKIVVETLEPKQKFTFTLGKGKNGKFKIKW